MISWALQAHVDFISEVSNRRVWNQATGGLYSDYGQPISAAVPTAHPGGPAARPGCAGAHAAGLRDLQRLSALCRLT